LPETGSEVSRKRNDGSVGEGNIVGENGGACKKKVVLRARLEILISLLVAETEREVKNDQGGKGKRFNDELTSR